MKKIVGIECGFPIRSGNRRIDELEKTQHYTYFAADLLKAKGLGIEMIRYGIPWHRVEPAPGRFDWNWMDGALDLISVLDIEPIVDLCHFGTPDWLAERGGFASPDFAERFADYVAAFTARYSRQVKWYTLINEPLITARFCGREGFWHPFRKDAFSLIGDHLVEAIHAGAAHVRAARPDAILMQNDACEHHTGLDKSGEKRAAALNEERFLFWDRTRDDWDVLGLDYYPWSEERHFARRRRQTGHYRGLYALGQDYWERYKKPLLLAETDAADTTGSIEKRLEWMEQTLADCKRLVAEGVPVVGYTWWPLIDNINWGAFKNKDSPDNAGLYRMVKNDRGHWERIEETPLVERFRRFLDAA